MGILCYDASKKNVTCHDCGERFEDVAQMFSCDVCGKHLCEMCLPDMGEECPNEFCEDCVKEADE